MLLYSLRRHVNGIATGLCTAAALFGLAFLTMILGALIYEGSKGFSLEVFRQSTPAPGSSGGLANAMIGSLVMTTIGVAVGTPLGLLAGTYLAEYGRYSKLSTLIRFINDILLSAPSIIIGLFVYAALVARVGHFSAYSGAVALAILVIPVVLRTTEDMLLLVPGSLREAATALGLPRSFVVQRVAYRAAKSGLVTGVLLAVARVSGETAPLLFTSLNNQFWSLDLNSPMASLPVVIFQFAMSPYKDWQQLAWTGAFLVTSAVLLLSIVARSLSAQRTRK